MSEIYRRGLGLPYNRARLAIEADGGFAPKEIDRSNGLEQDSVIYDPERLDRLEEFARRAVLSETLADTYVQTTLELDELDELSKIAEAYPFAAPLMASETELTLV